MHILSGVSEPVQYTICFVVGIVTLLSRPTCPADLDSLANHQRTSVPLTVASLLFCMHDDGARSLRRELLQASERDASL